MTMVRDLGDVDRFPYLAGLGLDPDDAGRLDVVAGAIGTDGLYVEAMTGETRLLTSGTMVPDGVWIAQRDLDALKTGPVPAELGSQGFGEGWGQQGAQIGGERSYPEEDAGGVRRVPHG